MSRPGPGGVGFGDEGHFVTEPQEPAAPGRPRTVNWPTVLVSAGVSAVVATIIVGIGVIGTTQLDHAARQPTVVRVIAENPVGQPASAPVVAPPTPAPAAAVPPATPAAAAPAAPVAAVPPAAPATPAAAVPPPAQDATVAAPAPSRPSEVPDADGTAGQVTAWQPSAALPADFAVTDRNPGLDQLNSIVYLLVAAPASDEAKARNLEAGTAGVIVPKTIYSLGLFRAPRGWFRVTGPVHHEDGRITAQLHSFSAGMPGVDMPITFVHQGGNWRLASSSLCAGVKAVGLPIYCNT